MQIRKTLKYDTSAFHLPRQELEYELFGGPLAAEMRQIGAGEAAGDYGLTTTEERKVNNVKVLIRESQ